MLRKQARSTFDQDLYKLLKINVFQKTMENLCKPVNVKLFQPTEGEKLRKLVAEPSFNHSVIFGAGGHLATVHMHKSRLLFNRRV